MISRRNYFAITIVMFIIFFMFLSIGVMTERWNDYETNPYWKDRNMLPGESVSYSVCLYILAEKRWKKLWEYGHPTQRER